jgi:hypothetical protein
MLLADSKATILLLGNDCSEDGRRKILSVAGDLPVIDLFSCAELAHVFGRERMAYGAIASGALAARLKMEADRLAGFRELSTE